MSKKSIDAIPAAVGWYVVAVIVVPLGLYIVAISVLGCSPLYILVGVGGTALITLGRRAVLNARGVPAVDENRRPVVYLRAFADDRDMGRRPLSFGRIVATRSEEEQLFKSLQPVGPILAIGRPKESLPRLGAARLYLDDDQWQQKVIEWFKRAALVVIRLPLVPPAPSSGRTGIWWEIEEACRHVDRDRLVFLVPRLGPPESLSWFNQILQEQQFRPLVIPELKSRVYGSRISGIVQFPKNGDSNFVPLVKPPPLFRSCSSPLVGVYSLALGPVLERLTGKPLVLKRAVGERAAKVLLSVVLTWKLLFGLAVAFSVFS
jgi:hypothetical protein